MPLRKTTKTADSEVLSNMSDMMAQMMKMTQEIFEPLPPSNEDMLDVHYLDHEIPFIIDDHDEIHATYLIVKVEVKDEITIKIRLEPKLNESVEEPIHFLAIAEKVSTEEVKEFDSFSFDNNSKARVPKPRATRRQGSSRQ
ncbi:hypothetical protein J1N35_001480 [Gossypium stocksii]|uniref:Uncharacterized protein n=1 Tax=Gossypium stocksii TaxID=47602 RepID=A0A9D3WJ01_9ROSI|nr:hypothetical protein J1N35_001480 [Gossypium stocksii]